MVAQKRFWATIIDDDDDDDDDDDACYADDAFFSSLFPFLFLFLFPFSSLICANPYVYMYSTVCNKQYLPNPIPVHSHLAEAAPLSYNRLD